VTGGARRLGRAIALALAREGYAVAVNYLTTPPERVKETEAEIAALGASCRSFKADVSKPEELSSLADRVSQEFGRVDLLVNNAAVFLPGAVDDVTPETWDRTLDINLKGPFFAAQAIGGRMREAGGGCIVNIASQGALQPFTGHIPYSVSKAGIVMLTRLLALALAPSVRVNAVAPGTIIVPGEEEGAPAKPRADTIPLKRYGTPEDIAQGVIYLAKAEYVTGIVLAVDGGATVG
jgi:NAD(P)-dependent dehydrogenase (short-subunit alcohol dehydrogenase family)